MAVIFIVDDDAAMCEALDETVRALGHQPLIAASGGAALKTLRKTPVDGVLLDLRMRDMDGLAVLRRIHEQGGRPPVTVLTAHASAANTIEAMRLGADKTGRAAAAGGCARRHACGRRRIAQSPRSLGTRRVDRPERGDAGGSEGDRPSG